MIALLLTALLAASPDYVPKITGDDALKIGVWGEWTDPIHVVQIIDNQQALVRYGGEIVILKGVPLKGVVDGKDISVEQWLILADTTTYTTVTGASKTVFLLRAMTRAENEAITKRELEKQEEAKRIEALRQKQSDEENAHAARVNSALKELLIFRKWNISGVEHEARIDSYDSQTAVFVKRDGKTMKVSVFRLSDKDKRYLRELTEQRDKVIKETK